MIITTSGIVLHCTKYSETSLIVKIYTEAQGTQSFIIKGAFGKKSRIRAALFSPLAVVNLTYDDHYSSIKYLKDISRKNSALPFDPARSTILLFYNELMGQLLFDAGPDAILFHFLEKEIERVEVADVELSVLPLTFLLQLSIVLGFFPENNYSDKDCYFSLEACRFQSIFIDERAEMPKAESAYLSALMHGEMPAVPRQMRNNLLNYLIEYYKMHNEQLRSIESVAILSAVLHS